MRLISSKAFDTVINGTETDFACRFVLFVLSFICEYPD